MKILTAIQTSALSILVRAPKQYRAEVLVLASKYFSPKRLREIMRAVRSGWRKLDLARKAVKQCGG